jgi:hypothetical protein
MPLQHPDVVQWRSVALGEDAPFAPTLLRVRGAAEVRGWTSARMAVPLVRLLGPRGTLRVLSALGQLREEAAAPLSAPVPARGMTRKAFLRLGAGATIAGGLVFGGAVPAFADQRWTAAAAWVGSNREKLPRTYREFVGFPREYRQEIYQAIVPARRAGLWREHIAAFQAANPAANAEQQRAYDMVTRAVRDDSMFDFARAEQHTDTLEAVRTALTAAFGVERARHLAATLGPAEEAAALDGELCSCSTESSYCPLTTGCQYRTLCRKYVRCGTFYQYLCNGHCY